jgi:hypothetical protein
MTSHLPLGDRAKTIGLQVISRGDYHHVDPSVKRFTRPDPSTQPHYNNSGHSAGQDYGGNRLVKKTTAGVKLGYNKALVNPPKPKLPVVEITRHLA